MDVKVFSRRDRLSKTDDELVEEASRIKDIHHDFKTKEAELMIEFHEKLGALLLGETAPGSDHASQDRGYHRRRRRSDHTRYDRDAWNLKKPEDLIMADNGDLQRRLKSMLREYDIAMQTLADTA